MLFGDLGLICILLFTNKMELNLHSCCKKVHFLGQDFEKSCMFYTGS